MNINDYCNISKIDELIKQGFSIIYLLTNKINFKKYVGFTSSSLRKRITSHIYRGKTGYNLLIGNSLIKHGEENFDLTILFMDKNKKYVKNIMEPYFIKFYKSYYKYGLGYNMTHGGEGTFGYKRTEEEKKQLSERSKGKKMSEETKKKLSVAFSGEGNHRFGTHWSDETREKIRIGQIGQKTRSWTDEQRKEHSRILTGKKVSDEARANMSAAQKGKIGHKHTEEHKLLVSTWFAKTYKIQNPNGEILIINNLSKFCRENEINAPALSYSLKSNKVVSAGKSKGWKIIEILND